MSSIDNRSKSRISSAPDSILVKKGKLPITLAQLTNLKLRQDLPAGSRVVVVFSANGNVDAGVSNTPIELTSINDVNKVQIARSMAHRVLNVKKRAEVQRTLARSILEITGPVASALIKPTPFLAQEVRKIRLELSRVTENKSNVSRLMPITELEKKAKAYLIQTADALVTVMKAHVMRHLTKGELPKEQLSFATALITGGIPKAVYTKLIQPNLIENINVRLDQILFGSKISKALKLTYEECNSPSIISTGVYEMLMVHNRVTLLAARNTALREIMATDLDENGIKRLNKIPLLLAGPGDLSKDWAAAQPHAPVSTGVVGEVLLRINAAECDFNSGILPLLTKPSDYWSRAIKADKPYVGSHTTILADVLSDAKEVAPTDLGYTVYPRDRDKIALKKALIPYKDYVFLAEQKEENKLLDTFGIAPLPPPILAEPIQEVDIFLKGQAGLDWQTAVIDRVFLKTATEQKFRNSASNQAPKIRLGPKISKEIREMDLPDGLQDQLVSFLMQFQSEELMKHAYISFAGEVDKMIMDGSYAGPSPDGSNLLDDYEEDDGDNT